MRKYELIINELAFAYKFLDHSIDDELGKFSLKISQ